MQLFAIWPRFDFETVSLDSGKALCDALAAGQVDCIVSNRVDLRAQTRPRQRKNSGGSGRTADPSAVFEGVPTFLQHGFDIVAYLRQGIGISPEVPQEIWEYLCGRFHDMIHQPGTREQIEQAGMAFLYRSGIDYEHLWTKEEARWNQVMGSGAGEAIRADIQKRMLSSD
jgi:tripartite-type tricarboxylate transporter receptor subunit TctC